MDVLSGLINVGRSKNGASRQVPKNAVVRSTLFDLSAQRKRLNDPDELIFDGAYRTVARLFSHAVQQAQSEIRAAGRMPAASKATRGIRTATASLAGLSGQAWISGRCRSLEVGRPSLWN